MLTAGMKGYRLSMQQARMWSLQTDHRKSNVQCTISLEGLLDQYALEQAFGLVIARYDILHTVFYCPIGMDMPVQVVVPHTQISCPILDLEKLSADHQHERSQNLLATLEQSPFDLEQGPLLRLWLVRYAPDRHMLYLGISALCADAATLRLLITEVSQIYAVLVQRTSDNDIFLQSPLQYVDVCAWQNKLLLASDAEEQKEYWRKMDLSEMAYYQFPFERATSSNNRVLDVVSLALEPELCSQMEALAQRCGVTRAAVLLTCWQACLWRMTGGKLPVSGIACDGRNYEELATIPGLYTRYIPFPSQISENSSFLLCLAQVSAALEQAIEEQEYFSWETCASVQDIASPPVFPLVFEYEDWPADLRADSLVLRLQRWSCTGEPCTLKFTALQCGTDIRISLHYDSARLEKEMLLSLVDSLQTFMRSAMKQPEQCIDQLDLLDLAQQLRLKHTFAGAKLPLPDLPLQRLFEDQVERNPHSMAVVCGSQQLTYTQLNIRANQVAHYLREQGVGPNVLVGLIVDRSIEALVCLLGILKAGGAYVPLDPEQPSARLADILAELQAPLLLTQEHWLKHLPVTTSRILCLEQVTEEIAQQPQSNPSIKRSLDDLAYIIYTSGSTGSPKGVMIRHLSIVNYTLALQALIAPQPGLHFATVSTLAADLGNTVIFCSLVSGGCLHIFSYETITSGHEFALALKHHPIDVLKIVPSHLRSLLASSQGNEILPRQQLILGGEGFPVDLLEQLKARGASCAIMNHYGPTEATIGVLVNPLGAGEQAIALACERLKGQRLVPLGRPIINTQVYILDQQQRIVPVGVVGELYLAGEGLATGYLHRPEQTTQRFLTLSLPSRYGFNERSVKPVRVYRTGDLARYTPHGEIEFVGRADTQVKVRGYRVELGEIEAVLGRHPLVQECAVALLEDGAREPQLVAYVVLRQAGKHLRGQLREYLREYLPAYMVPSVIMLLRALPLTRNGKVDRQVLLHRKEIDHLIVPGTDAPDDRDVFVKPRDAVEFQLLRIWEDILQVQVQVQVQAQEDVQAPISVTDNFFDLGGHSILAVRLMSRVHQQFGRDLAVATLFQHPTLEDLAVLLRQQVAPEGDSVLVPIQSQGTLPPFFCVHPSGGTVFRYTDLAHYLGLDQPFYGLQTPDFPENSSMLNTLEEIAAHYITAMQTIQSEGPYYVGGWSLGGVVAFEITRQLRRQGKEVALLALLDTIAPTFAPTSSTSSQAGDLNDIELVRGMIKHFDSTLTDEDLDVHSPEELLSFTLDEAKKAHIVPIDTDISQFRRLLRIQNINMRALRKYSPQTCEQHITLFRVKETIKETEDAASLSETEQQRHHTRGWSALTTQGVNVHIVPGEHASMLEEPHVRDLAAALSANLKQLHRLYARM